MSGTRSGSAVHWPTIVLLALAMASGNVMLGVFSALQEGAKAELRLSDGQMGLLQGLAVSIPLALLAIPVGLAVDRGNRVRLLFVMSAVWTAGTLLTVVARGMPLLFLARMLAGVGANLSTTIAISIAADVSPPAQRGRSLLLLTIGKYAGTALAFALGGLLFGLFKQNGGLAQLPPWRSAHLVLGLASLILTLGVLLIREPERHEIAAGPHAPVRVVAAELWERREFLIPLFVGQAGVLMADASAAIWAAPVLSRSFRLEPENFAGWMGAVIFSSGVLGAILGGLAADFGHRRARRGGILLGAVIASILALPAAAFPLAPSVPVFAGALFALLLGGTITGLVTATAIAVLVPNELRGLCIGAFIAFGGLIAFGVSPSLVTALSSVLGGEGQLAPALAIVGLGVSLCGAGGFWLAMRRTPDPIR
ncbi:MAG: MFS transporter [Novosphingobium sp.]